MKVKASGIVTAGSPPPEAPPVVAPLQLDPRLPAVGRRWQHVCHPNVYECIQRPDGVIEVMAPNTDEVLFEVHGGYDVLCTRDMGQGPKEETPEEE